MRGVLNDAVSIYFADATLASGPFLIGRNAAAVRAHNSKLRGCKASARCEISAPRLPEASRKAMGKLWDHYLIGGELSELVAEFDRIEAEMINLGQLIGAAYGADWRSRGLRIAQLVHALKVRVEDYGYDRLSSRIAHSFRMYSGIAPVSPKHYWRSK
jgi:hypothetical protein